mmetsp:Transcript_2014/g.4710  ORF Transcript_2014/g.4710 Transcript_2014/m.4710 type:complete len:217 (-) Transcript_2014:328-978(-)
MAGADLERAASEAQLDAVPQCEQGLRHTKSERDCAHELSGAVSKWERVGERPERAASRAETLRRTRSAKDHVIDLDDEEGQVDEEALAAKVEASSLLRRSFDNGSIIKNLLLQGQEEDGGWYPSRAASAPGPDDSGKRSGKVRDFKEGLSRAKKAVVLALRRKQAIEWISDGEFSEHNTALFQAQAAMRERMQSAPMHSTPQAQTPPQERMMSDPL